MPQIPQTKWELAPEGTHVAIGAKFIDLGTQTVKAFKEGEEDKEVRQCLVVWDLPNEKTSTGANVTVRKKYTYGTSSNGNFFKDICAWFGLKSLAGFDVDSIIGKPAMVTVQHSDNGNYANVKSVTSVPKGTKVPKSTEPQYALHLTPEDFDPAVFNELSENMQGIIANTKEYLECSSPKKKSAKAAPAKGKR